MIPEEGSYYDTEGFTCQSATEETSLFLRAHIHLSFPVKMQNSKPNKPGNYSYENDNFCGSYIIFLVMQFCIFSNWFRDVIPFPGNRFFCLFFLK